MHVVTLWLMPPRQRLSITLPGKHMYHIASLINMHYGVALRESLRGTDHKTRPVSNNFGTLGWRDIRPLVPSIWISLWIITCSSVSGCQGTCFYYGSGKRCYHKRRVCALIFCTRDTIDRIVHSSTNHTSCNGTKHRSHLPQMVFVPWIQKFSPDGCPKEGFQWFWSVFMHTLRSVHCHATAPVLLQHIWRSYKTSLPTK
jgi:hypothetical protein